MKILSDEYDKAELCLRKLTSTFLEQEKAMKAFQDALGEIEDENEQAPLLIELGKMMDEFTKRISEM